MFWERCSPSCGRRPASRRSADLDRHVERVTGSPVRWAALDETENDAGASIEDAESLRLAGGDERTAWMEAAPGRHAARIGCLAGEDLLLVALVLGDDR